VKTGVLMLLLMLSAVAQAKECVVLLHGLARTADSMTVLEERLVAEGYTVVNVDYPSTQHPIEVLAGLGVGQGIAECERRTSSRINFVTHSMGGILVRAYLKANKRDDIGRVVMLGPPNQGSEVVDALKDLPMFELLNGPAGLQLGTGPADIPKALGPVDFELGVIAGTQSVNLLLSTLVPGDNDGKVSVEATKVERMQDFLALPTTHPLMMRNQEVIEQTVFFLRHGQFKELE
jgi:pimeloyl-ACP methyl ester carboxylesterase